LNAFWEWASAKLYWADSMEFLLEFELDFELDFEIVAIQNFDLSLELRYVSQRESRKLPEENELCQTKIVYSFLDRRIVVLIWI